MGASSQKDRKAAKKQRKQEAKAAKAAAKAERKAQRATTGPADVAPATLLSPNGRTEQPAARAVAAAGGGPADVVPLVRATGGRSRSRSRRVRGGVVTATRPDTAAHPAAGTPPPDATIDLTAGAGAVASPAPAPPVPAEP